MKLLPISLLVVCSAFAGEYAILSNGSRIYAESHENNGAMIRLNTPTGPQNVAADQIVSFVSGPAMRVPPPPVLSAQTGMIPSQLPWNTPPAVQQITLAKAHALIRAAAARNRVPAALVRSITAAESGFNPNAVSNKGAIGLMQLMPTTAHQLGADPHIPAQNIEAGTQYLRFLMDKYQHYRDWLKRVIAAYNAGPAAVDRYHGVPPFPETRTYVARVLAYFRSYEHARW